MTVREFIQQIADGTLHYRNDIVNSIPVSWDKTDLVNDMFYYDRVEDPKTGAIPVLNDVEKQRLYNAIKFIYDLYQQEISYFPIWELSGEDLSDMPNSVESSTIQTASGYLCEFDNLPCESTENPFNDGDHNKSCDHYNYGDNDDEILFLKDVYVKLVEHKYLEKDNVRIWLYICTGQKKLKEEGELIKLNWLGTQASLAVTIDTLFNDLPGKPNVWKVAEKVFLINDKPPRPTYMSTIRNRKDKRNTDRPDPVLALLSKEN